MQLAQSLTLLTESKENLGFGLLMKIKIVRSIGGYLEGCTLLSCIEKQKTDIVSKILFIYRQYVSVNIEWNK